MLESLRLGAVCRTQTPLKGTWGVKWGELALELGVSDIGV